jgi:hypothetical protein
MVMRSPDICPSRIRNAAPARWQAGADEPRRLVIDTGRLAGLDEGREIAAAVTHDRDSTFRLKCRYHAISGKMQGLKYHLISVCRTDECPRPLSREDSQAATRTALLDAAEELILESSMPGLSLRAVCTRAGFTQGAFYSSFASRELLLAVMERNLEERVRTFGEMTLDYHAMTLDQTIAQIGEWLATVSDRREWAQMAIELRLEAVRNPALPAP